MNGFQWIACTLLGLALVRDLLPRAGRGSSAALRTVRTLVWCTAIVAIYDPRNVTRVANLLGIGRGADIVLYVLRLASVAVSFFFYAQQLRLRRELSALNPHIALMEATRGGQSGPPPAGQAS